MCPPLPYKGHVSTFANALVGLIIYLWPKHRPSPAEASCKNCAHSSFRDNWALRTNTSKSLLFLSSDFCLRKKSSEAEKFLISFRCPEVNWFQTRTLIKRLSSVSWNTPILLSGLNCICLCIGTALSGLIPTIITAHSSAIAPERKGPWIERGRIFMQIRSHCTDRSLHFRNLDGPISPKPIVFRIS